MSDGPDTEAPAVVRGLREVAIWVLPMVPFTHFSLLLCSLSLALATSGEPSQMVPSYLQDRPSSPSSSHLEEKAGKEVLTGRHELPEKGLVSQGREGGEPGPCSSPSSPTPPKDGMLPHASLGRRPNRPAGGPWAALAHLGRGPPR